MNKESKAYLYKYLSSLPEDLRKEPRRLDSFHFCLSKEDADFCAELVKSGRKKATSSLEWCFTIGGEVYPEVGELDVITNWTGVPQCIIKIISIEVKPFSEVDEQFAIEEGEGDLSLESWRKAHWQFFSKECKSLGMEPEENMPVVLQRFMVLYP